MNIRGLVAVLAVLVVSPAEAAWTKIGQNPEMFISVDLDSIRTQGDTAKIWVLYNRKSPVSPKDSKEFNSRKVLEVVNCKEETSYSAYIAEYPELDGGGRTIVAFKPRYEEGPFLPGSVIEAVGKIACRGRTQK